MMVNSQGVEHAKYFMKKGKTHPKHAQFRANTMSTPWKIEVQRVTERGSAKKFFFQILLVAKICQLKKSKFFFTSKKKDSHFYDEKLFTVGFEAEKGFPTQQCYHTSTVSVVFI